MKGFFADDDRAPARFGAMRQLATIKPPGESYDDTRRFLNECHAAGMASYRSYGDGRAPEFEHPIGKALLELWRWCEESESRGIRFAEAVAARDAAIDRNRGNLASTSYEQAVRAAASRAERDPKRVAAHEAFGRAKELGL